MISVCMTTYNGQEYVEEQINSILCQLGQNDELIISDDGSSDLTLILVKDIIANDARVKLLSGPQEGLIKNFENALLASKGEYIFLSDQDDVWHPDKVNNYLASFEKGADLVISDAYIINESGEKTADSFYSINGSKKGLLKNLIKNSYLGCCLAFRRDLMVEVLPFPEKIPMHDWWIGLVAEYRNLNVIFLKNKLLYYRRHHNNVSATGEVSPFGIIQKIVFRFNVLCSLVKLGIK